jgi:photosystem II stability/assembly factor-like uncharacterized protein
VNASIGMAVGGDVVLRTTDGGATWRRTYDKRMADIRGAWMTDSMHAAIVGVASDSAVHSRHERGVGRGAGAVRC